MVSISDRYISIIYVRSIFKYTNFLARFMIVSHRRCNRTCRFISGFPQPTIVWSKNGQELTSKDSLKISYSHNHVRLELRNVNVKDAGRYTCTLSNDVGSASSTADLVVKSKRRNARIDRGRSCNRIYRLHKIKF